MKDSSAYRAKLSIKRGVHSGFNAFADTWFPGRMADSAQGSCVGGSVTEQARTEGSSTSLVKPCQVVEEPVEIQEGDRSLGV